MGSVKKCNDKNIPKLHEKTINIAHCTGSAGFPHAALAELPTTTFPFLTTEPVLISNVSSACAIATNTKLQNKQEKLKYTKLESVNMKKLPELSSESKEINCDNIVENGKENYTVSYEHIKIHCNVQQNLTNYQLELTTTN